MEAFVRADGHMTAVNIIPLELSRPGTYIHRRCIRTYVSKLVIS